MNTAARIGRVVFVVSVNAAVLLSGCGKSESRREYERAMREVDADAAKMNARMAQEEEQRVAVERKSQQEEQTRQAAIKKQEDGDAREERQSKEKETKEDIQRLASLNVEPKVTVSAKLRGLGVTAAFRGENLETFQKLFRVKDWNGLIKALGYGPEKGEWLSATLPSPYAASRARQELEGKSFSLFVETSQPLGFKKPLPESFYADGARALYFILVPNRFNRAEDAPFLWDVDWNEHPDGNGYLHKWNTYSSEIFLCTAEASIRPCRQGSLEAKLFKLLEEYEQQTRRALEKKELGEFTESQLNQEIVRLRTNARSSLTTLMNQY